MILRLSKTHLFSLLSDGTDVSPWMMCFTGRTIRAAIDNIVSHGRPARVEFLRLS